MVDNKTKEVIHEKTYTKTFKKKYAWYYAVNGSYDPTYYRIAGFKEIVTDMLKNVDKLLNQKEEK